MVAVLNMYKGAEFIADYTVKYLTSIFWAVKKEQLLLTDGTNKKIFSDTPLVIKKASWDYRQLPAILIGEISGAYRRFANAEEFISSSKYGDSKSYKEYGNDIEYNVPLTCMATTKEEAYRLADITCIFLVCPTVYDYYYKFGLKLPDSPRQSGCREVSNPPIDHPIYAVDVTFPVTGFWRFSEDQDERLIDIIADVTSSVDLDL